MKTDFKGKDYYLEFINKAKVDKYRYQIKLDECIALEKDVYKYISDNIDYIDTITKLDFKNREEFKSRQYQYDDDYYNKLVNSISKTINADCRKEIITICKYLHILYNISKYNELVKTADNRTSVTTVKYNSLVRLYYLKVQKALLEGFGYKFVEGFGVISINRYKVGTKYNIVDFNATRKAKEELIAKGIKPYDKEEAEYYAANNIPYDGVKYTKYKTNSHRYDLAISPIYFDESSIEIEKLDAYPAKYRNMTHEDLAKTCNSKEDIYDLPVGLFVKLNVLLINYPELHFNFIRNVEQQKYKFKSYNRKD